MDSKSVLDPGLGLGLERSTCVEVLQETAATFVQSRVVQLPACMKPSFLYFSWLVWHPVFSLFL
jgi:hypothetical protein